MCHISITATNQSGDRVRYFGYSMDCRISSEDMKEQAISDIEDEIEYKGELGKSLKWTYIIDECGFHFKPYRTDHIVQTFNYPDDKAVSIE